MPDEDYDVKSEEKEKPSDRRRREKTGRDSTKPRKHRPRILDPETGEYVKAPSRRRKDNDADSHSETNKNMIDVVPELARTASTPGSLSRSSIPYPTFSKAHSKEAVSIRDDISTTTASPCIPAEGIYTPDATNLAKQAETTYIANGRVMPTETQSQKTTRRPPSPPDTISSDIKQSKYIHASDRSSPVKDPLSENKRKISSGSIKSWFGKSKEKMNDSKEARFRQETKREFPCKPDVRTNKLKVNVESLESSDEEGSEIHSTVTSIPPPLDRSTKPRIIPPGLDADDSPDSYHGSSPRTPTATTPVLPARNSEHQPIPYSDFSKNDYGPSLPRSPASDPTVSVGTPQIDYLLQNGGLLRPVSRTLMSVTPAYAMHPSPRMNTSAPPELEKVFGPFYNLLEQYESVILRNGSVAVATGYRSVARRLLDRLENVFARDLPTEGCSCIMCQESERCVDNAPGWGDILEFVSGRREVPRWPALEISSFSHNGAGPGIPDKYGPSKSGSPVNIDPDIAEEFHQHYLKQSRKTKASVDHWLNASPGEVANPPPDVDDETLTFAILTRLHPDERPQYNGLLAGTRSSTDARLSSLSHGRPRAGLIVRASLAIQRLYRLPSPPRDPEVCVYLVRNPAFHNLVISLSEINNSEWEILISGRFDGFLWSGAEGGLPQSGSSNALRSPPPRNQSPSVNSTDYQSMPSRMGTPTISNGLASNKQGNSASPYSTCRQAVSNDEDAEIAALAELELRIFQGMEQLEDAFEGLHRKAEIVRSALRNRGAGLAISAQRRGMQSEGAHIRLNTPGFGERGWNGDGQTEVDIESDWDDGLSEIAPNDSASQISSSRYRRPKRRVERRTPALVEEEDEDE